ncbi:MAG: right-handed parallel beta-helix repeat-containing protein [Paludibacter sp.]
MKYYLRFTISICFFGVFIANTFAQRGYNDAPYKRYEANLATLTSATITAKSFKQSDLQSEASDQICVTMTATNAACEWTVTEAADGLVVRYSVPDGQSGTLGVYSNGTKVSTLTLTSNWSWEYLATNGNTNNVGVVNTNPKMRFDEVRVKLTSKIPVGGKLKLIRETGNVSLDFAELEPVPSALTAPAGAVTFTGNGNTLQSFIDANGGKTIFVPAGVYNIASKLWFGSNNTKLQGAGMWYTQLNFTYTTKSEGGLYADAMNISFSNLYLTTVRNSRTDSYKGINGVFTSGSVIENVWVEHFEAGAWIAQYYYSSTPYTDGLIIRNCRFRNNYADGVNLCKGTRNTLVEHCSFRNNGDDDMAIWSADGIECQNNTFQFCTSENCWRASGCAIYGGLNNKANNLLIKDNLEVGLRVNNCFPGIAFNASGLHEFTDITIDGCGTFNDLFNNQVGAIDLVSSKVAGTQIKNVKFRNIDIIDSKNDAIFMIKTTGDGFYNLVFENITVNGTGLEYPNNNVSNSTNKRGYGILFAGSPTGNGSFCGITYSNRGGNALSDVDISAKGTMTWTALTGCITTSTQILNDIDKSIYAYDKTIVINELYVGENISVYNLYGVKVYAMKATHETEIISSLKEGIYLVSKNGGNKFKQLKVMLK